MVSREEVQRKVRAILEDHGIGDKDKLEHIPEAVTGYFGEILVSSVMELNGRFAKEEVERVWKIIRVVDG